MNDSFVEELIDNNSSGIKKKSDPILRKLFQSTSNPSSVKPIILSLKIFRILVSFY